MLEVRRKREEYSRDELIRAAYMAGHGSTAVDIARFLKTTPGSVYVLFCKMGLSLVDKHEEEQIVQVRILRQHFDTAGRLAAQKEIDPRRFLSRLLRAVLSDKELTAKVIERAFK